MTAHKKIMLAVIIMTITRLSYATEILPEKFPVYTSHNSVGRYGYGKQRTLPVFNHYRGEDGGYLAIYSRTKKGSAYSIGDGIYVVALVRLKGEYTGRIFVPAGYDDDSVCENKSDMTTNPNIMKIALHYLPHWENKIWFGGDTGGFVGCFEDYAVSAVHHSPEGNAVSHSPRYEL